MRVCACARVRKIWSTRKTTALASWVQWADMHCPRRPVEYICLDLRAVPRAGSSR